MSSFLVIVHPYPPTPSSGAHRWGAIVKYLRRMGHDVRVLDPIPLPELVTAANAYDAGIVFFPPLTANLEHALPNKFFDLIQARVAIVTGPSPEMAGIVREFGCGVVADGFTLDALVTALEGLTPEGIAAMKAGAGRAAEVHSAERNRDTLLALVEEALAR